MSEMASVPLMVLGTETRTRNRKNFTSNKGGKAKLDQPTELIRDDKATKVNEAISTQLNAKTLRETGISNKINWILRHGAVKVGLELDERGYANCRDLVSDECFFMWEAVLRLLYGLFSRLQVVVDLSV